jgi:uncharacterized membrane-anchored protein YhcB (DUF1043 family)
MMDVTLFGTISLDLEQYIQLEKMSFSMYIKLHANGIVGYGIWEGSLGTKDIKQLGKAMEKLESSASEMLDSYDQSQNFIKGNEVFNSELFQQIHLLPDLQIRKLGLILGISWEAIPSFGCIGEFSLKGDKDENWGIIAFYFDSTNPAQCLFDLKFPKDTFKTLEEVILGFQKFILENLGIDPTALQEQLNGNKIFRLLEFDGFYQDKQKTNWVPMRAKIAATDVKIGNVYYDTGIFLQGKISLLNKTFGVLFNLKIDKKGIIGFGKLKEFRIDLGENNLFRLEESRQSVKPKDVILKQNLDIAQAEFQGPYLSLNAPFNEIAEAKLHGSANVHFLGVQLDTQYLISTEGISYSFNIETAIGNLSFNVLVESLSRFEAESDFDVTFNVDIFSLKAIGETKVFLKDKELKATLKFEGEYYDPFEKAYKSLGDFDLEFVAPPELVEMFTDILKMIQEKLMKVAAAIFEEVKRIMAELVAEIKQLAEDVHQIAKEIDRQLGISESAKEAIEAGREAIRLIGQTVDEIKKNIEQIKQEIEKVKEEIEKLFAEIAEKAKQLEQQLNHALEDLGVEILRIIGQVDQLTLPLLKQVASTLQQEWNDAEGARVWHYNHRVNLEKERNLYNWAFHTVRIAYHFNLEGVNEGRNQLISIPLDAIKGYIYTSEAIANELNRLEREKEIALNKQQQKEELLSTNQKEQEIKNNEISRQNEAIREKETEQQNAENIKNQKETEKIAREAELKEKREKLNEITPAKASQKMSASANSSRIVKIQNIDQHHLGFKKTDAMVIWKNTSGNNIEAFNYLIEHKQLDSDFVSYMNIEGHYLAIDNEQLIIIDEYDSRANFLYDKKEQLIKNSSGQCLGFKKGNDPEVWVHLSLDSVGKYERITVHEKRIN